MRDRHTPGVVSCAPILIGKSEINGCTTCGWVLRVLDGALRVHGALRCRPRPAVGRMRFFSFGDFGTTYLVR